MGHVRDRWMTPGPTGRKVRNDRWGKGSRWQAKWTERGVERAKTFPTKEAAEHHLARMALGEPAAKPVLALTFGTYADEWRRQRLNHRTSTAVAAEGMFRRMLLPSLGGLTLAAVTRADVQAAVVAWSEQYAPSTVHIAYGYVAAVFKHAVEDRLVQFSPCVRIVLPAKVRDKVVPLTVHQVQTIAERVPPWYRSMVVVAAASGLRGGELRGLTWDRAVDGVLTVDRQLTGIAEKKPVWGPPKSSAGVRTVALGQVGRSALKDHQEQWPDNPHGLVWVNRGRSPVTRGDLSAVWRAATDGMDLRDREGWHALRHFHASCLISAGLSPRAVADRLGHSDPSMTMTVYAHLWPSDQERAIAASDEGLEGLA